MTRWSTWMWSAISISQNRLVVRPKSSPAPATMSVWLTFNEADGLSPLPSLASHEGIEEPRVIVYNSSKVISLKEFGSINNARGDSAFNGIIHHGVRNITGPRAYKQLSDIAAEWTPAAKAQVAEKRQAYAAEPRPTVEEQRDRVPNRQTTWWNYGMNRWKEWRSALRAALHREHNSSCVMVFNPKRQCIRSCANRAPLRETQQLPTEGAGMALRV